MDFNTYAKDWDNMRRTERARVIAGRIRESLPAGSRLDAMEYGCGTGLVGMQLLDAFSSVLFMDSSQGMIDELKRKIEGIPAAGALCLDLMQSDLPGRRFGVIFSSMVLHHIRDTEGILSRFHSLLHPGGRLIIVDLDSDDGQFHAGDEGFDGHNGYSHAEMASCMRSAGFRNTSIDTFYHSERAIGNTPVPYSLFIAAGEKAFT